MRQRPFRGPVDLHRHGDRHGIISARAAARHEHRQSQQRGRRRHRHAWGLGSRVQERSTIHRPRWGGVEVHDHSVDDGLVTGLRNESYIVRSLRSVQEKLNYKKVPTETS